jgi:hypothetical protein
MPQADSPESHLYTFASIYNDGSLTLIVEDDRFCEIDGTVNILIVPEKEKRGQQ